MQKVVIFKSAFERATALDELLSKRRIPSITTELAEVSGETLVVSARYEQEIGGPAALTALVRKSGFKEVIIIDEQATTYVVNSELGGRLLRIATPARVAGTTSPLHDPALIAVANLIGARLGSMVAADPSTSRLLDLAQRVAATDVTVFINGPTGSGKEVLARQIHRMSRRADAPFIAINCAAIPENMLEGMLFGHEKGAFTGASTPNKGIIRAADGGTLLLDEISEMPLGLQSKLLRVLQERSVTPLGAQKEIPVDVRVIATSNRDMAAEVAARRFREDLYYRLNVFPIRTQALRTRSEDIPVLAMALLQRHHVEGSPMPLLSAEAIAALRSHGWPGNVRELENVMQRALVMCEGTEIAPEHLIIDAGDSLELPELAEAV